MTYKFYSTDNESLEIAPIYKENKVYLSVKSNDDDNQSFEGIHLDIYDIIDLIGLFTVIKKHFEDGED